MSFNSTISSLDPKLKGKGFIISHDDAMTPRLVPTPPDYCGIEDMGHLLYIMAMDIIYKFQCEDFQTDNFAETRKYIKAYYQHSITQKKPWFPSAHLRKLQKEPDRFFKLFKFVLEEDLNRYHGPVAQELIKDLASELAKVKV
jgi:hypothetical protein